MRKEHASHVQNLTPQPENIHFDALRQRLAQLDRRVRWIHLLRGAGQTAVTLAVCAAAGLLLALVGEVPLAVRM